MLIGSGDHIIEEKLKALEHYRLDKPHVEEDVVSVNIAGDTGETAAELPPELRPLNSE